MKTNKIQFYKKKCLAAVVVPVLCLLLTGCGKGDSAAIFTTSEGLKRIQLELARTKKEKKRGLMFRSGMGEDQGMLFFFETGEHPSFWMKNTYVSLDILFLSGEGVVVDLFERLPPCALDPCPVYASSSPARFVLELKAGFSAKHGIRKGDRVSLIISE